MNYDYPRLHRSGDAPEIGTPEMRKQIGKDLRTAREVQEVSLEQIVAVTKINIRYLQQIEAGSWSFLPPTYIKAFILAYAEAVRLQSDKLFRQVVEIFPKDAGPDVHDQDKTLDRPWFPEPRASGVQGLTAWVNQNRSLVFYGALALVFIILIILYIARPIRSPMIDAGRSKLENTPARVDSSSMSRPVKAVTEPLKSERKTFSLELHTSDTCYVKVELEDSLLYERTLWPGNRVKFSPYGSVRVSLGNAPAVTLAVNGSSLPPFPEGRRVRMFKVSPDGILSE